MKYIQPLKMLMVAAAIVTPIYLVAPTPSFAAKPMPVCIVGHSHATIQLAVDDTSCEFINVPEGTFQENVYIDLRRDITIRGSGPDSTIVDGSNTEAPVFWFQNNEWTLTNQVPHAITLKGMTITGGTSPRLLHPNGGGISMYGNTLTVKDCLITGNDASTEGGGIYISNTTLTVKDSTISGNSLPEIAP